MSSNAVGLFMALHIALIVGQVIIISMVMHLAYVIKSHQRRADAEWESLRIKLDVLRSQQR